MGVSSPESITSSIGNLDQSHRESETDLSICQDEIDHLRAAKNQAEIKLQLLKKRYETEASLFTETRVEHIFKINGAREYLETLKQKAKIKDDIIKLLKEDLESKSREVKELQDRCREAERRSKEYMKAWKDAQMARDRLETEKMSSPMSREASRVLNNAMNMSSASSLTGSQVPPPPPVDVPTIEELLRTGSSTRARDPISPYMSLDTSIPPPPDIDVPLDEITPQASNDKRAFVQEKGQFLCHIYAAVELEASKETLSDIIELVEAEEERSPTGAYQRWKVNTPGEDEICDELSTPSHKFHVTLIRGHRAIYYHQINQILNHIENECNNSKPFCLCLDKLRIFNNHEGTKQFMCLATRDTSYNQSGYYANFTTLKRKLRNAVDQFATRLTGEDETDDTMAHCSLMCREMQQAQSQDDLDANLHEIEKLCVDNLDDYPMCLVKVDKIHVKIGNRVYAYNLSS